MYMRLEIQKPKGGSISKAAQMPRRQRLQVLPRLEKTNGVPNRGAGLRQAAT